MSPRALAAPLHRHLNEDEYSFVLEGKVGALLGDEVVTASAGDLIFKPRGQWHTFWNAGDAPARILEIISPAGFEQFFRQVVELGGIMKADPQRLGQLSAQYALEMDPASVPGLVEGSASSSPDTRSQQCRAPGGEKKNCAAADASAAAFRLRDRRTLTADNLTTAKNHHSSPALQSL